MTNKRKLDDLIDSLSDLNFNVEKQSSQIVAISQPPPAKRGHYLPITVSKLNLKPCNNLIKTSQLHKFKNIFGLSDVPNQESFTREEVEILIDQRERMLYKHYLSLIASKNIPDKIENYLETIV